MPSDKHVAFSKITTEQPSVDVEKQSDDNYLLLFEPDEGSNQVQQPHLCQQREY